MIKAKHARPWVVGAFSALVMTALGTGAAPALALPTTWVLHGASLDDGGTVSGEFTIGPYGFLTAPIGLSSTTGSLLGGYSYHASNPSNIVPGTPPAYGIDFYSPSYNRDLHIVFKYPLDSTGPDPIVAAMSYECAAYRCPGPDPGSRGADTRYFTAGDAIPASEPASFGLLAVCAGAVMMLRCRRGAGAPA
jgi:hypothetical protein